MTMHSLAVFLIAIVSCSAFYTHSGQRISPNTKLFGIGDFLKNALANDPSITGPPPNAGLSNAPQAVVVEFLPSKKQVKAFGGQKVSDIAKAAGVTIKYSCKKGECNTCSVNFNGVMVKACQATLPQAPTTKKITIGIP